MNTHPIAILTDSTCDIPEELVEQYNIIVIPQTVIWGDREYRDRLDLQPQAFYQRLNTEPGRPTSSLPGIPAFLKAFDEAIQAGAGEILLLTVSSAMSGTYQMALEAAGQSKVHVQVVDSRGPTMSLGWQVLTAARQRDRGAGLDAILEAIDKVREKIVLFVGMDTLEYLKTGGRLGGAAKWAGVMLQIKPLVSINHKTGLVEPVTLARTHKSLIEQMYRRFFEKVGESAKMHIAVLHGNAEVEARALAERIRADFNPDELLVNITGPVLGINTGPGALALCGYAE